MPQTHVTMAANGRLVIPANLRAELGLQQGGTFVVHTEGRTIRLEPIEVAVRRVQDMIRTYVPKGVSLSDELSAERRVEAANE